jgi:hypothetical protein
MGSPKFRIRRPNHTWQILGNKDIATKNYIINGEIVPVPFFSKNTIPLAIDDLLTCLLLDKDVPSVYRVDIDIGEISTFVKRLVYFVTEKSRCTVQVTLVKSSLDTVDFDAIDTYDANKDEEFRKLIEEYIDNKEHPIYNYIGSIRDGIKGKAILLDDNTAYVVLEYKAAINKAKKEIILKNLNPKS